MRKTHSNVNLLKGKNLSLQELTKLNSMLDHEQNRASYISKEMVLMYLCSKTRSRYQRKMRRLSTKISGRLVSRGSLWQTGMRSRNRSV